jgi:hypothetical protein
MTQHSLKVLFWRVWSAGLNTLRQLEVRNLNWQVFLLALNTAIDNTVCIENTDKLWLHTALYPFLKSGVQTTAGTEGYYNTNAPLTLRRNAAGSKSVTATNTITLQWILATARAVNLYAALLSTASITQRSTQQAS